MNRLDKDYLKMPIIAALLCAAASGFFVHLYLDATWITLSLVAAAAGALLVGWWRLKR